MTTTESEFTTILCNKKTNFIQSFLVLACLFSQVAQITGYFKALEAILQTTNITIRQQYFLETAIWPYFLQFLTAPLIDSYFIKSFGKCKTYIIIGGIINFIFLTNLYHFIDIYIDNHSIFYLWINMFIISICLAFQNVAIETWMLTIFENNDQKCYGGYASYLGQTIGTFVGYSIFALVNSKDWLNKNIFTKTPIEEPLVSINDFILILIQYCQFSTFIITQFIAEQKIVKKTNSPIEVVGCGKKIQNLKKTRVWILWIIIRNVGCNVIEPSKSIKMVELGFKREWFVNTEIISTPFCFVLAYFSTYLLDSKRINETIWWIMVCSIPFIYFDYYIYWDFSTNKNDDRTYLFMILSSLLSVIHDFIFILDIAFMNIICNINIGSTHQTLLMCTKGITTYVSSTLGLFLSGIIDYNIMWFCYFLYYIQMLKYTYSKSKDLDNTNLEEFSSLNSYSKNLSDSRALDLSTENTVD